MFEGRGLCHRILPRKRKISPAGIKSVNQGGHRGFPQPKLTALAPSQMSRRDSGPMQSPAHTESHRFLGLCLNQRLAADLGSRLAGVFPPMILSLTPMEGFKVMDTKGPSTGATVSTPDRAPIRRLLIGRWPVSMVGGRFTKPQWLKL